MILSGYKNESWDVEIIKYVCIQESKNDWDYK